MSAEDARREAIQRTAQRLRESDVGRGLTQTQAEDRVRSAVRKGDVQRENNNR